MKNFVIITDSSSNMTPEQMREFGIDAIVPFHLYANGNEYLANDEMARKRQKLVVNAEEDD